MKRLTRGWSKPAWALILGMALTRPAAAATCIQRHGPDGLPFTIDDPLRLGAASYGGQFFLDYTATDDYTTSAPFKDPATGAQNPVILSYLNLTTNSVSELPILQNTANAWDTPLTIGGAGSHPPGWPNINDYYVAGNAMAHDIAIPASSLPRDDPGVMLDPSWFVGVPVGVLQVNVGSFHVRRAHTAGLYPMTGAMNEHLAGSFHIDVGAVDVKIGVSIFGHDIATWKNESGQGVTNANQLPAEFTQAVADQIAQDPVLSGAGVSASAVIDAAIQSTHPNNSITCASIVPGTAPGTPLCQSLSTIMGTTKDALVQSGYTSSGGSSTVQSILDLLFQYTPPPPQEIFAWMPWLDPYNGPMGEKVVDDVIKNKFKDEFNNLMMLSNRPSYSGSSLFNSGYIFGPKNLWLIEKPNSNNMGPLVENYLYAKLNRINPYDVKDAAGNPTDPFAQGTATFADWQQVDLITGSAMPYPPPPLLWPPQAPNGGARMTDLVGDGSYVITGDESASGNGPTDPGKISVMIVVVHPVPDPSAPSGYKGIQLAYRYRTFTGSPPGGESDWVRLPADPTQWLPAPPDLDPPAPAVRHFHVHATNPTRGVKAFDFGWDFEGTGQIQSVYGNTTHYIAQPGQQPICFARDATGQPGDQRTGLAWLATLP